MKQPLKSLLSLLLAMCMALSLAGTAVWAAEDVSPAAEESVVAQAEEAAPAEDAAPVQEAAPVEDAPAEDAPAEEPAEEPAEAAVPAEGEVEPQLAPAYYPTDLTVTGTGVDTLSVKWTHGDLPGMTGSNRILLEGRDITAGGSWEKLYSTLISNARSTTTNSGSGSQWGDLPLVTRHQYEFRLCYTDEYGNRGTEATAGPATYYNKDQEKALVQQKITNYLTVGLSPSEGENKVYTSAYDEKGLSANQTELLYNRPLYQMGVKFTGTSESTDPSNPGTLLNFHATYASRVPCNDAPASQVAYVEGLDYRLEGLWFINKNGQEQFQSLSESAVGEQDFSVNMNNLAFGCNYVKLRLICYGYSDYGVDQYWVEQPIYFNIVPGATPLGGTMALTNARTLSLGTVPGPTANVSETYMTIWYRAKGTADWSETSVPGGSSIQIGGLKPDTNYEWQAQYFIRSVDHNGAVQTLEGPKTDVFTTCTAVTAKPKVKSAKVSKSKVVFHKTRAAWIHGKWYPSQSWYTTEFTVTYTLDKPSKNIKGYTSNGVYARAKGNKVSFRMSVNTGKKKKKAKKASASLRSSTNPNQAGSTVSGLSPALKVKIKIK